MYICIYTYICIHILIYIYTYTYDYIIYTYTYIYIYIHTYIYVYINIWDLYGYMSYEGHGTSPIATVLWRSCRQRLHTGPSQVVDDLLWGTETCYAKHGKIDGNITVRPYVGYSTYNIIQLVRSCENIYIYIDLFTSYTAGHTTYFP